MSSLPLDQLLTTQDLDVFSRDIDVLLDGLYESKKPADVSALGQNLPRDEAALRQLQSQLQSLPKVSLAVAFYPAREHVKTWVDWLRKQVDPNIIIDIHTDARLIAGAKIEYRGKYIDLSAAKNLDGYKFSLIN